MKPKFSANCETQKQVFWVKKEFFVSEPYEDVREDLDKYIRREKKEAFLRLTKKQEKEKLNNKEKPNFSRHKSSQNDECFMTIKKKILREKTENNKKKDFEDGILPCEREW